MSSFHGKIGRGRLKKRKNKNYRFVPFLAEGLEKIPQNQQKNSKKPLWLLFKRKQAGKAREREKIKIMFRSVPTGRVRENSNKTAKKLKN